MVHSHFEQLKIYKLAEKLADEIWAIVQQWKGLEQETIGKYIVRAVDEVGANIARGHEERRLLENQQYLKTAKICLNETRHWLRRAYYRNLLTSRQVQELKPTLDELSWRMDAYFAVIQQCFSQEQ